MSSRQSGEAVELGPYYELGASGCWSHAIWSGPWPVLAAYDAVVEGDNEKATRVISEMTAGRAPGGDGSGDEGGRAGHALHEYSDYIQHGPPRPPFSYILDDAEAGSKNEARARKSAERWAALCEKYRPEVEAKRAALVR